MRNLIIIGARGAGREYYNCFLDCKENMKDVKCVGFLDDKKDALDGFDGYPPIIDSVENYQPKETDVFICALGDPKWIKHYTDIIKNKGGKFISLIHPQACIGINTKIGTGSHIARWALVSNDVTTGNHVSIGPFSVLGHDTKIGNYSHLGAYTFTGGFSIIGEEVTLHPRSNILPHKKIGDKAIVGAGSIVIKNVPADATVFGNPARILN